MAAAMLKSFHVVRKQAPILLLIFYTILWIIGVLALSMPRDKADYRQGSFIILSMCETALVLFVIPLLAVHRLNHVIRGNAMAQFLPTERRFRIAVGMFRYPLLMTFFICLIPGLTGLLVRESFGFVPVPFIVRTFFIMLTIAVFALSIGFYAAIVCKNALSAAGFALLIVALICTEPIWFGPIINFIPDASLMIQSSLLINPFVSVASALNFDILRMDPFYQICPIGQLKFHYPSFWSAATLNVVMALLIFWRSIAGIRRISAPSV